MGQTDVYLADLNDFRSGFGLSTYTCTTNGSGVVTACNDPHFKYVLDGADPGVSTHGDLSEADLDLEWSGAVAKGAQIIYVNSSDTFTSYYYAIDQNLAPVISLSYGFCEFDDTLTTQDETELKKANSQGITFVNSSGDSGATECDYFATVTAANLATQGLAVSYPASSPEVTGVGGTGIVLADIGISTYWGSTNGSNGGSALSYVPEQAWNDDLEIYQFCLANSTSSFCKQGGSTAQPGWVSITSEATAQTDIGISSTGGGASNCETHTNSACSTGGGFAKPSWQTVTVAGAGSVRMSPDISFLASPNFPGYIFCTPLTELGVNSTSSSCAGGITSAVDTYLSIIGGTSASAPVFAGMVALMNQKTASTQGNLNPNLYFLAATAPSAFHDTTTGDNKVSCEIGTPAGQLAALVCPSTGILGYSSSTGFDLATGLGSLDLNNFAVALASPPDFTASSPTTTLSVFSGQSGTATITVVPKNNFTGSVGFACTGLPSGSSCSFSPATVTPPTTTQTTATITGSGSGGTSTVAVTATTGVLSQVNHPAASIALTVAPAFTLTPSATSYQVAQGSAIDATVTVALATGFTGTITFTCADSVSESVCTAPPATAASGDVSFHITTSAPTAKLDRPMDRSTRIFYAALMPGLLGIFFTFGSKQRSYKAMRLLGLIAVLSVSTMWMASCGGSGGGSTSNPGTPKGTYTITASGASGGSTATSSFQLVVQ
jgi:subtilase family serine protease